MKNENNIRLMQPFQYRWQGKDVFAQIFKINGKIFRAQKNRKTLRFEFEHQPYFLKLHKGVGWREIFKNLILGRWPVLGAKNEWEAIQALTALNVPTTPLVAYGKRGKNPAHQESFIITKALENTESLEDVCRGWVKNAPDIRFKKYLIGEVARIARLLHTNGINHRDFYLCHFLLDKNQRKKLYLIDLHRAQLRQKTPNRWKIKDIAGLYFSAMDVGLTKRDCFRFIKSYFGTSLRDCLLQNGSFLRQVERRAIKLYAKDKKKNLNEGVIHTLKMADEKTVFYGEKLLRVLKGKRWVILTTLKGKQVVLKLFAHRRHAERELSGYQQLLACKVRTPPLLKHGWLEGKTLYALVFEYINPAEEMGKLWKQVDETQRAQLLKKLISAIAILHDAGLKQNDLHMNNFLLRDTQIYVLDMADIVANKNRGPLTVREGLVNLALLLAELPATYHDQWDAIYHYYIECRAMPFTLPALSFLKKQILKSHRQRLLDYGKKMFRTSSECVSKKLATIFWVCDRRYDTDSMRLLLSNPENILCGPATKILKNGNTCTVMLVRINEHRLVVKRYNIKNIFHALSRAFRRTRAAISWRNAHQLTLAKIATPKPIALIEKRWGFIRRTSYFITEYVAGQHLDEYFQDNISLEEKMCVRDEVNALFARLNSLQVSHGDCKATNIMIAGGHPILLDLDAMRFHCTAQLWKRAADRDHRRFMKNWKERPDVAKLFAVVE